MLALRKHQSWKSINTLRLKGARLLSTPSVEGVREPGRRVHNEQQRFVIFSGIQPTGVPHLGNYLGALRQWKELQDAANSETTLLFSLVDLHAVTVRQSPEQLRQWNIESFAMLLAIGLDPNKSIIYHQSKVREHAHLMWLLNCETSLGQLRRMTQWKDKTTGDNGKEDPKKLKNGLFSYPVLQAADVLLYQTTHVPVGHDQAQHLELARTLAGRFNHLYGKGRNILVPPETIISPARRIMSLSDPMAKMSKSHANEQSRILLTDPADVINAKVRAALTDSIEGISYDQKNRPGVCNLIDILYHLKHEDDGIDKVELGLSFEGKSMLALKECVADAINELVAPIRDRYASLIGTPDPRVRQLIGGWTELKALVELAAQGAEKASALARPTIEKVERAMGLDGNYQ